MKLGIIPVTFVLLLAKTIWSSPGERLIHNFVWVDSRSTLNAIRQKDEKRYFEILTRYGLDKKEKIDSNPILSNWLTLSKPDRKDLHTLNDCSLDQPRSSDAVSVANPISFEAAVIGGTATFLTGRAKEEALTFAIQRLIEDKASDTAIQLLFPSTHEYLVRLRDGGALYSSDLILLQKLVQIDLESLPDQLIGNIDRSLPYLKLNSDQKDVIRLANRVFISAKSGSSLPKTLDNLNDAPFEPTGRMRKWTDRVELVARAFAEDTSMSGWMHVPRLDPADSAQRIFAGLLYEELRSDSGLWASIQRNTPKSVPLDSLRPFLELSQEIVRYFQGLVEIKFTPSNRDSLALQLQEFNRGLNGILTAWNRSGLGADTRLDSSALVRMRQYQMVVERVVARDYQMAVPLFAATVGQSLYAKGFNSRSVMFLTQLATVKSDTGFEKLLQAYALPMGSSSVKRTSKFDISLNGYVGLSVGGEMISDKSNWSVATAVSAPVGLSFTTASGYLTVFVSAVDLGNLVSARLWDRTTSQADLSFQQILAPGLGIFGNLPKSPFTFGAYGRYVPQLRTLEENGKTINQDVFNVSGVVLVDIPFFTLCTRQKR